LLYKPAYSDTQRGEDILGLIVEKLEVHELYRLFIALRYSVLVHAISSYTVKYKYNITFAYI